MTITSELLNRPIATAMAVLCIALGGVLSFFYLPVDLMPNVESSNVTIYVGVRGGMPPQDIERLVTEPIEEAVSTMAGMDSMLSVSRKDRSTITLSFDEKTDIKRASLDVSERLSRIKGDLPKEIERPIVARYNENDHPVVILTATSSIKSPEMIRTLVERDVKPVLSRMTGVANIEIGGGRQRKILVEFEKSKLENYGLSIMDVIQQLSLNNVSLVSGQVETSRESLDVQFLGDFKTLDEMRDLGVSISKQGSRVRLKDIAVVRDYYLEPDSYARVNNQPSVSIYVQKESGANTITVSESVINSIPDLMKKLPSDVGIGISVDQSVAIRQAISDVREALILGALFTALVLWFFLNHLRLTTVILFSIPVAVLATFMAMMIHAAFMKKFGWAPPISINVMSLLGVALGIGRMVDDSIVVFENIMHRWEQNKKTIRMDGFGVDDTKIKVLVVSATKEMAVAVASSTVVMVVIFLPIILISPDVRAIFSDVAFTVVAALAASLIMAVTVVPLLTYRLIIKTKGQEENFNYPWERTFKGWLIKITDPSSSNITDPSSSNVSIEDLKTKPEGRSQIKTFWDDGKKLNFLKNIWKSFWNFGARWAQGHQSITHTRGFRMWVRRTTAYFIRHRFLVLGWIALSFVCSVSLYIFGLQKEFIGSTEKKEFIIFVELDAGTKLDISDKVVAAIEAKINSLPEVKEVVKTVSSRVEGWSSKIYVTLAPGSERTRTAQDVIKALRPQLKDIGGEFDAFIHFSEPQSSKKIVIDVFGQDYLVLKDVATQIAQTMEKVGGLRDIKLVYKEGQPEVALEVDRSRSSLFGLSSRDIADTLHAQVRGLRATYFNAGDEQVETVARLSEEDRRTLDQVSNLTMMSNTTKRVIVPVRQILEFKHGHTPSEVWRKDKERVIQVNANREDVSLSKAVEEIKKNMGDLKVPLGYHFEFGGDYKRLLKSEKEFFIAFFIMVVLVYMVLASFFESYSQPFLMLLTVPLATAGSMPALWMTNTSVNMGVYIGLLLLGGTVVSNGIILIDRLNVLRESRRLFRSVLYVGWERSRPIFMTSLTTIAAMLPLMLKKGESAEMWAPLALTVVSGLAVSSVLTLFVVPAAYVILNSYLKGWQKWKSGEIGLREWMTSLKKI